MKFIPHQYQSYAVDRILDTPYIGLFLEMGLGKTVSTLTAIDELLFNRLECGKPLVIAPLRVAQDTWSREVSKWDHLKHLRIAKVLGSAKERRAALAADADVWVVNRENVPWLVAEYGDRWPFDTVVIDELSSFKNPSSQRFKALRRVRPLMRRVIGLTGTPAPNSLADLWAPVFLLDRGERLGPTVKGFRDRYFTPGRMQGHVVYDWREKNGAEGAIYEAIRDITVSMKAEDWLELPEWVEVTVPVELDDKSRKTYKQLEKDLLLPYADGDVVATTAAVLSNKLLQLASGAIYDENSAVKDIHEAKLDALEDIIEAANGKPVMVAYHFQHSLDRLKRRFPSAKTLRKGSAGAEDIEAWNSDQTSLLLLHPQSAGHGLNLQDSSCQHVVWYDQIWSLELTQQFNARVYRQGQTRKGVIMRLVTTGTMDEDAVQALERKATGQEALMQAVKARIQEADAGWT